MYTYMQQCYSSAGETGHWVPAHQQHNAEGAGVPQQLPGRHLQQQGHRGKEVRASGDPGAQEWWTALLPARSRTGAQVSVSFRHSGKGRGGKVEFGNVMGGGSGSPGAKQSMS